MDIVEQGQAFEIQILEGPLATQVIQQQSTPGLIALVGRALPYRPIKYQGKQRVITEWYPGNPQATQQIMGPTQMPTTINGIWKDLFLGNGAAMRLAFLFDSVKDHGALVEVRWGSGVNGTADGGFETVTPQIIRRGTISDFTFTPERPQDVAWEMTFDWAGGDVQAVSPVFGTKALTARDGFGNAVESIGAANDSVLAFLDDFATLTYGGSQHAQEIIGNALGTFAKATASLTNATDALKGAAAIPQNIALQAMGVAQNAVAACQTLSDFLVNVLENGNLTPRDDAFDTLTMQASNLLALQQIGATQAILAATVASMQIEINPDVLAEVRVPAGVDLRDLALQYYGDPDSWWLIANANGMSSSLVPLGASGPSDEPNIPITIPRPTSGALNGPQC